MRLLTWNLNHKSRPKHVSPLVAQAIAALEPDGAVLTEYVRGADHSRFCDELASTGLRHVQVTPDCQGHNQVLVCSRSPLQLGAIQAPPIARAVASNVLHVYLPEHDITSSVCACPTTVGSHVLSVNAGSGSSKPQETTGISRSS